MKIQHYYAGIRRILMIMRYSLHLQLASNRRTSESSEELRIPLKKGMCGEREPKQGISTSVAERGSKIQGFRLSQQFFRKHKLSAASVCEHLRGKHYYINMHQDLSFSHCAPIQKLHNHISALVLLEKTNRARLTSFMVSWQELAHIQPAKKLGQKRLGLSAPPMQARPWLHLNLHRSIWSLLKRDNRQSCCLTMLSEQL